jgi:hypothetical protein
LHRCNKDVDGRVKPGHDEKPVPAGKLIVLAGK